MPSDGQKARPSAEVARTPGLLGRALCCVGILVLMQNLMLLRVGSDLLDRCAMTSLAPIYSLDGHIPAFKMGAAEKQVLLLAGSAHKAIPTAAVGSAIAVAAGPDSKAIRYVVHAVDTACDQPISQSTSTGSSDCASKCAAVPTCNYYSVGPTGWCILSATCPQKKWKGVTAYAKRQEAASPSELPKISKQPVPDDRGAGSGMVATREQLATNAASQVVSAGSHLAGAVVMDHIIGDDTPRLSPRSSLFSVPREELRLFGRKVPNTVRLCVGFSTVSRKKDYVLETVGTMLGLTADADRGSVITAEERAMVVTVAHLADFNMKWVKHISEKLQVDYSGLVKDGQFHGIHAPEERYPNLQLCPPFCAYKDEPKRVKWRSKQNIDYAFLMYYAAPLAPYYLQIEDDIKFSVGWVSNIVDFISTQFGVAYVSQTNAPWRMIDFSELGFIGKCFQSNELIRLAQFLLLFYDQMPCDLLVGDWMQSMNQGKRINYWASHPSLFQHVGIFRTLGGYQPLQEKKFGNLLFNNPSGKAVWNFTIMPTYEGKFVYISGGDAGDTRNDECDYTADPPAHKGQHHRCWFWAKEISYGDHFTIVFDSPISFKAVFIEFGHSGHHPTDVLHNATLQVADSAPDMAAQTILGSPPGSLSYCGKFHSFGKVQSDLMVYWEEKVSNPPVLPVKQVQCFRIAATAAQQKWAVIFQIQVRGETVI